MDHLERMFRVLVQTIRARFPQYLSTPFDVAELHQTILPYRHHRAELGFDTNEDYEVALLELLSGAKGFLIVDERMRDVLSAELASKNPDPGTFRQFAKSQVALSPEALRRVDGTSGSSRAEAAPMFTPAPGDASDRPGVPASVGGTIPDSSRRDTVGKAEGGAMPSFPQRAAPAAVVPQAGERCRACGEALPADRPITFCPHCGQNLTIVNCQACGAELEVGWRFCPSCGRPAAGK
jgi:double zinc ribbon protein